MTDVERPSYQAQVATLYEAIANVTDMVNKGTFPDGKLLVLASLVQSGATMLVALQLESLNDTLAEHFA